MTSTNLGHLRTSRQAARSAVTARVMPATLAGPPGWPTPAARRPPLRQFRLREPVERCQTCAQPPSAWQAWPAPRAPPRRSRHRSIAPCLNRREVRPYLLLGYPPSSPAATTCPERGASDCRRPRAGTGRRDPDFAMTRIVTRCLLSLLSIGLNTAFASTYSASFYACPVSHRIPLHPIQFVIFSGRIRSHNVRAGAHSPEHDILGEPGAPYRQDGPDHSQHSANRHADRHRRREGPTRPIDPSAARTSSENRGPLRIGRRWSLDRLAVLPRP